LASQRSHLELASPWLRRALVFAERRAHGVVVNCKFLERHLIEDAGVRPERIHLCYNGIDLDRFQRTEAPRPASLPADSLVIGTVCMLRPEKGLPTLLEAFAAVHKTAPNVRLAIVGNGSMLPELKQRAVKLGILDACVFEPATAQVPDWLRHIDIFVLPSLSEAFSNSIMEAMACGCCVVASRVGGNPELIEEGVTGLLFPPGDASGLANALRKAMADPEGRQRMAEAGRHFIRPKFSRQNAARRMGEIYTQMIEKHAAR
jgi:glycosyltransferase involved in cell wall biosynthesis